MLQSKRDYTFCICATLAMSILVDPAMSRAQAAKNAVRLIESIKAQRQGVSEMLQEGLIISEIEYEGMVKHTETEFSAVFKRPNLFRIRIKGKSPLLLVSDGESLWTFRKQRRTYRRSPAPSRLLVLDNWVGFVPFQIGDVSMLFPASPNIIKEVKLLGRALLETEEGASIPSYVLEGKIDGQIAARYDRAHVKLWIAADELTPSKIETTLVPKQGAAEHELKITILNRSFKYNVILPHSLFVFTPPADARLLQ